MRFDLFEQSFNQSVLKIDDLLLITCPSPCQTLFVTTRGRSHSGSRVITVAYNSSSPAQWLVGHQLSSNFVERVNRSSDIDAGGIYADATPQQSAERRVGSPHQQNCVASGSVASIRFDTRLGCPILSVFVAAC